MAGVPRTTHRTGTVVDTRPWSAGVALLAALAALAGSFVAVGAIAIGQLAPLTAPVGLSNARTLLGAMLGAVVTIGAFTFWMRSVMVQLASSEFSPRTVSAFLHDAFQRRLALSMVAAVSCLVVLMVGLPASGERVAHYMPALAVAGLVTVAATTTLLVATGNASRALSVPHVVRQMTDAAFELSDQLRAEVPDDALPSGETSAAERPIRPSSIGWVTSIDRRALLEALPAGRQLRILVRVGAFVAPHEPVVRTAARIDEEVVRHAVSVDVTRTTRTDLAFAVQQLNDVATHAMTGTAGDTSTASEVIDHLSVLLADLVERGLPSGCLVDGDGRAVVSEAEWAPADYAKVVFERLRSSAGQSVMLTRQVLRRMGQLVEIAEAVGDRAAKEEVERQAVRLVRAAESLSDTTDDAAEVARVAASLGLA